MKLKRIAALALSGIFLLAGCSQTPKEPEKINLMVPQGATALATLSVYNNEYADVTTVSGSDPLTAELAKTDSSYDVIIAPINLGAKMIESGNTKFRLASVITWGNLYIIGSDDYQAGEPFAAFGENAVPGKILSKYGYENVTYFSGVQDVQAQLLSGKFAAGLIAEPAATATINKAKEQGLSLHIIKDLQEEETVNGQKGYPQAAIFVKEGSEVKAKDALSAIETFLKEGASDSEKLTSLIEAAGIENLGVPNAKIVIASWERQNLHYQNAADVKEEITDFLKLFNITFHDDMLSK